MQDVTKMEMDDLRAELNELKLGLGGVGTTDIMHMHHIEDEIDWRIENGYADLTPAEIEEELAEKEEVNA